jgi:hypothetical protein
MISEWSATQFSLTVYESTGAMCADESTGHLCKHFRWWFLRGQRLCFSLLFLSQQVLWALRIPSVISVKNFRDDFWVVSYSVFLDIFWVNMCCARWGFLLSSLETVSMTISKWSATQFSLTFSESTGAVRAEDSFCHLCKQFSWWFLSGHRLSFPWHFLSPQVLFAVRIPCVIAGNNFGGYFWMGGDSVFLECLWVNSGYVR